MRSHYVLWVLWKSVNRQHVSSRDKQKSKCQGLTGTLTSPSARPEQGKWEVLEKIAGRLTGSKGEPGPANCRSCAFWNDSGSFVLFYLFCLNSFALAKWLPSHPNSCFVVGVLSVRARSVFGREECGDTKPPPRSGQRRGLGTHTFVPVSTGCSGTALCVPKPKDLSQSLTPAVSPLVKVSNVLQNGRHVENSLCCVAASRDLGKHNCFGVRFYLAPWSGVFW